MSAGAGGTAGSAELGGSGGAPPESNVGVITVEGVSTWKGNATAAYTIIHDDACDYTLDSLFKVADPELVKRGLRAGFGAIVERCQERPGVWAEVETLVSHGHEILCHSWTHPDFIDQSPDLSIEIDQATNVLAANIPDQKLEYFIFPYDSFTQPMIDHLGQVGYTGARAGTKGVTPADFSDPLREDFDVYNDENSIYYPAYPDVLKAYVDDAISQQGWAIRELHGVADASWEPIPLADYQAHLDYVKAKVDEGALWVDTPSTVGHYRFARQYCGVPSVNGAELRFPPPSSQCTANATALSVIVDTEIDTATLNASQNGNALPTQRLAANRFLVDVDPTLGAVVLMGS
ncbi:MAG TPA: polysaccharide deacetylase family protein [Polyangiaceae bacterium]|nr:polysaccharide deacetylase family protein [Polyangiaceae bacterium]